MNRNPYPKVLRGLVTEDEWKNGDEIVLDEDDRNIGPRGAKALSKFQGSGIYIMENNVGYKGAQYLVEFRGQILELNYSNIGDVGLTWIPLPYLYLKAGYRFVDHAQPSFEISRGLTASISVLF